MTIKEDLNTRLYNRLHEELEEYGEQLKALPPEEILKHAYEYAGREDIVLCLEYNDITANQAKALLREKRPLESIYKKYEETGGDQMSRYLEAIESRADELIEARKPDAIKQER